MTAPGTAGQPVPPPDGSDPPSPSRVVMVPVTRLRPNPDNVRGAVDDRDLATLVADIARRGVLVPLRVLPAADGRHPLVAGHRRLRAAVLLGLEAVPATVERPMSAAEVIVDQLLDAEASAPLSVIEKAAAYQKLLTINPAWTLKEVAAAVCSSPAVVSKSLTCANCLHRDLVPLVLAGRIGARTAYRLATVRAPARQVELGRAVADGRMSGPELAALLDAEGKERRGKKPFTLPVTVNLCDGFEAVKAALEAALAQVARLAKAGAPPEALRTLFKKGGKG